MALDALSVFDTRRVAMSHKLCSPWHLAVRRITSFMTMTSAEILPAAKSKKFSFGTRVSSASFGARPATSEDETEMHATPVA